MWQQMFRRTKVFLKIAKSTHSPVSTGYFGAFWVLKDLSVDINPFSTGTGWTLYKVYIWRFQNLVWNGLRSTYIYLVENLDLCLLFQ